MTSENRQMMIYGANGYTGELIAKEAVGRGFKPVLAGRNKQAIGQLAESLNLTARVFGLNSVEQVIRQLKDICAGVHLMTMGNKEILINLLKRIKAIR